MKEGTKERKMKKRQIKKEGGKEANLRRFSSS